MPARGARLPIVAVTATVGRARRQHWLAGVVRLSNEIGAPFGQGFGLHRCEA